MPQSSKTSSGDKAGSSSNTSTPPTSKPSKKRLLSPDPAFLNVGNSTKQSSTPSTSKGTAAAAKKPKKVKKTKPFNKLFEGVIFSMSGFQNPLRGQLRDKAVEMGARYKADWDRSCTHLMYGDISFITKYFKTQKLILQF